MSLRLAAALDGALYNDMWDAEGELPQLDDPGELAVADPESDSDEEVAPPADLEAEPEGNAVVLGRRFTEEQRRILLEAFAQDGKVSRYENDG